MRAFCAAAVVSILIAVQVGALVSRIYWGYYLYRPAVPREVSEAERLLFLTPLKSVGEGETCEVEIDLEYSVRERIDAARHDPYYAHEGRLLLGLHERGISPAVAPPDTEIALADIFRQLQDADILVAGEADHSSALCLAGVAVHVRNARGESALVMGFRGREVSNDHYPYYEVSFRRVGARWQLDSSQRYFYDVAGIEGLEAPAFAALLSVPVFFVTCGAALFYRGTTRIASRVRRRRTSDRAGESRGP